jgi:hypothetical protein
MRKIISVLTIATLLLPLIALAQAMPKTCHLTRDLTDINTACTSGADVSIEDYGMCCLVNTIYSITDWIFYILMAFVGIMIIIGAFTIITAGGSPEKVTAGRNYILYAIIGMVVAFFARAIPAIVKTVIGM